MLLKYLVDGDNSQRGGASDQVTIVTLLAGHHHWSRQAILHLVKRTKGTDCVTAVPIPESVSSKSYAPIPACGPPETPRLPQDAFIIRQLVPKLSTEYRGLNPIPHLHFRSHTFPAFSRQLRGLNQIDVIFNFSFLEPEE